MSYTVPIFESLRKAYPSWDALQTFLTSSEGGSIRSVGEGKYRILRYTKGTSDLSLPHAKWFRSVIWDTETNLPVCVGVPKAEKDESLPGDSLLVQDYMDGMMINVSRNAEDPTTLQIATRSQLGAEGKFYTEKTFAQMFDDALTTKKFTQQDICKWLGNDTFASFVLQHPDHRVVARCRSPHLWIVHTGSVSETGVVTMNEGCAGFPESMRLPTQALPAPQETTVVHTNPWFAPKDRNTWFSELCDTKGWFYQGVTMKDGQGNRWRMRNPNYLYLRTLRGSESTPAERFLRLRNESKVSEYLKHYSEDRDAFWNFEQTLRNKTQEVFQAYCDVHKAHTKKFEELPAEVKPCVFKLHAHYLADLRPKNEKVYMKHAVELVNNLPVYEQKRLLSASG